MKTAVKRTHEFHDLENGPTTQESKSHFQASGVIGGSEDTWSHAIAIVDLMHTHFVHSTFHTTHSSSIPYRYPSSLHKLYRTTLNIATSGVWMWRCKSWPLNIFHVMSPSHTQRKLDRWEQLPCLKLLKETQEGVISAVRLGNPCVSLSPGICPSRCVR